MGVLFTPVPVHHSQCLQRLVRWTEEYGRYRGLGANMWVLGLKPGSSGKAASVCDHLKLEVLFFVFVSEKPSHCVTLTVLGCSMKTRLASVSQVLGLKACTLNFYF